MEEEEKEEEEEEEDDDDFIISITTSTYKKHVFCPQRIFIDSHNEQRLLL
jgi:hypothetical protein